MSTTARCYDIASFLREKHSENILHCAQVISPNIFRATRNNGACFAAAHILNLPRPWTHEKPFSKSWICHQYRWHGIIAVARERLTMSLSETSHEWRPLLKQQLKPWVPNSGCHSQSSRHEAAERQTQMETHASPDHLVVHSQPH